MYMSIESSLAHLGLTTNETQVYLALLELGEATGYSVSKQLDMKKPTAYFTLEELRKKGLALRIPKANKHVFVPKDPNDLVSEAHQRVVDIESVLPYLLSMKKSNAKSDVIFYDGPQGILDIHTHFENNTKGQTVLSFYGHYDEKVPVDILEHVEEHQKNLKKNKTIMNIIVPDHHIIKSYYKKEYTQDKWQVRYLPLQKFNVKISVHICDTKTWIISRHKEQGIMIDNEDIASFMKQMFDMVWEYSEMIETKSK